MPFRMAMQYSSDQSWLQGCTILVSQCRIDTSQTRLSRGRGSQNGPQPVHIGIFDGIWLKKVVRHELDAAIRQGLWRVTRIHLLLTAFDNLRSVLYDEFESWIKREKLKGKSTWTKLVSVYRCSRIATHVRTKAATDIDDVSIAQVAPREV